MTTLSTIAIVASVLSLGHLAVGFAIGCWAMRRQRGEIDIHKLETKRAKQLLECLRELTGSMTAEVEEHREQLESLSEKLEGMDAGGNSPLTHLVIDVVSDIMQSNQQLKDRLTSAELQLQQQTAEIETSLTRALTDPLTGLHNRRALDDDLERRVACWHRKQSPVSVVLLDIDHFKQLNDTYGHAAGDKVLRQVAHVLKATFRTMDLVTRFGGEEFAVVLPETANQDACTAARKTIEAIREARFSYEDQVIRVTICAGVATAIEGEFVDGLLKRADEGLYASKHAGRNCGHFHDGTNCELIAERVPDSNTAIESDLPPTAGEDLSVAVIPPLGLEEAFTALRNRAAIDSADGPSATI